MVQLDAKTALLFPGQGAQYVGMAKSFYDADPIIRDLFDRITCEFDIKDMMFNGPAETLRETRYSQASIYLASLCIATSLHHMGLHVDAAAGLSLGEYSALSFAGSFDTQTGVNLLIERGRIMADTISPDTGMTVIVGLDERIVQECCQEASSPGVCEIASYLAPGRTVITGHLDAVNRTAERCRAKGARMIIPLETSGAFHSTLARDAAQAFQKTLILYTLKQPTIPIYYNFDGTPNCDDLKAMEAKQLYTSIQFTNTIENMCADGITTFVAVGPGSTLAGLARETAKSSGFSIRTHIVETYDDALKLMTTTGQVI